MSKKLLTNCTIFTGESVLKNHSVLIEDGLIQAVLSDNNVPSDVTKVDLRGNYLIPGFVDLQVNGGGGSFFTNKPSEENIRQIFNAHLEFGTTSYLPTVVSTSYDNIIACIEAARECYNKGKHGVIGMHLEGPFFNPIRKGAHSEKFVRKPTDEELHKIVDNGKDVIKLMTIAPEQFSDHQIKIIQDGGIRISAGHSDASFREATRAFDLGIDCVTHLYNAMSQFTSRNPGLVGAFFDRDEVWGGIIVDGIHSEYASVRIAHKQKKGKLYIVSDASFVKHPVKEFEFEAFKIHYEDGKYLTDSGNLAGSAITMLESLQNTVKYVGLDLEETVKMTSTYPAQFLGVDGQVGLIAAGRKADLVVLNTDLELEGVFLGGKVQEKEIA